MASRVREVIVEQMAVLLDEEGKSVPALTDEAVLLDSGLDSLGFAVLVTRLDDELGYDPFTLMDEVVYPRTLGDFVEIYERFAPE